MVSQFYEPRSRSDVIPSMPPELRLIGITLCQVDGRRRDAHALYFIFGPILRLITAGGEINRPGSYHSYNLRSNHSLLPAASNIKYEDTRSLTTTTTCPLGLGPFEPRLILLLTLDTVAACCWLGVIISHPELAPRAYIRHLLILLSTYLLFYHDFFSPALTSVCVCAGVTWW